MTKYISSPGPGWQFVRNHVSLLQALLSHGFNDDEARALIAQAGRGAAPAVRFSLQPGPAWPQGCTVALHRVRGNHAQEWRQPGTAGPAPARITGRR